MTWNKVEDKLPTPGQSVIAFDGNQYNIVTFLGSFPHLEHPNPTGKTIESYDKSVYWEMQTCECCNDMQLVTHWAEFEACLDDK